MGLATRLDTFSHENWASPRGLATFLDSALSYENGQSHGGTHDPEYIKLAVVHVGCALAQRPACS